MRRVVPIVVVLIVVIFVVRAGLFRKSPPGQTPTPPGSVQNNNTASDPGTPPPPPPVVPRHSDPAITAVIDEMLAAWDKIPAVYAEVETMMPEAAGNKGKTTGKGKYWLQKKDGRLLIHFDLRNSLKIKKDDGSYIITGENLLSTIDGKHLYSFINQPGQKQALKKRLNYDDVLQIGGPYLFFDLVTNNKLTLLPEEMRDNHATKVIQADPNNGAWQTMHYFDKATGIRTEMTELDAQGQTSLQIKLVEIDTNPTISEDQFQFVVPEGVTLEDQTSTP